MSLTAEVFGAAPKAGRPRALLVRIAVAAVAVALVAAAIVAIAALFASAAPPPPPARNPFGMGMREAAPAASGIGAYILAIQGSFFRGLQAAVSALKESGAAFWSLMGLGFAYGVFHAAGPGHGKAVIAAYIVASERALLKGLLLSLAAALLQALVAVAIVGVAAVALRGTAATMTWMTGMVEVASFAAVAALGAVLTWRKAGKLLGVAGLASDAAHAPAAHGHDHGHGHGYGEACGACGHVHLPPPAEVDRMTRLRDMAGVVLAAGIRPCSGAILVLVFALSQGLFPAGVAAAFVMALGTALTTGAIAALAVFAKALALRFAGGRGTGETAIAGLELLAAAFVLVLGVSLLAGMWSGAGGS
ncbi:MAG TPA: nickel transporter [Beijerinckiaceae bacterium]|jgi:ABC-type nickel/cobalt efflux system permease component RcnA